MNKDEHIELQIKNLTKYIQTLNTQALTVSKEFLLNLRLVCEVMLNWEYDISTQYYELQTTSKTKKTSMRNKTIWNDAIEKLLNIEDGISEKLHYNFGSNIDTVYVEGLVLSGWIDSINNLLSEKVEMIKEELKIKNLVNKEKIYSLSIQNISISRIMIKDALDEKYTVPMYQRRFSWTSEKIISLFKQMLEFRNDLGIFYKTNEGSLVDGQQRLHSSYVIFKFINAIINDNGAFPCPQLKIEREREIENFRGNFGLFENEILKTIENENDGEFKEVFKKIKETFDGYDRSEVKERKIRNILNSEIYIKNIKEDDGSFYFNKINDGGMPLEEYENLLSIKFNDLSLNNNDKIILTDVWCKLDTLIYDHGVENPNIKNFLSALLKSNDEKIRKLNNKDFTHLFKNIAEIMEGHIHDYISIPNAKFMMDERIIESKRYHQILYSEIILRKLNLDEKELTKKFIKDNNLISNGYFEFSNITSIFIEKILYLICKHYSPSENFISKWKVKFKNLLRRSSILLNHDITESDIKIYDILNNEKTSFLNFDKRSLIVETKDDGMSKLNTKLDLSILSAISEINKLIIDFNDDKLKGWSCELMDSKQIFETLLKDNIQLKQQIYTHVSQQRLQRVRVELQPSVLYDRIKNLILHNIRNKLIVQKVNWAEGQGFDFVSMPNEEQYDEKIINGAVEMFFEFYPKIKLDNLPNIPYHLASIEYLFGK